MQCRSTFPQDFPPVFKYIFLRRKSRRIKFTVYGLQMVDSWEGQFKCTERFHEFIVTNLNKIITSRTDFLRLMTLLMQILVYLNTAKTLNQTLIFRPRFRLYKIKPNTVKINRWKIILQTKVILLICKLYLTLSCFPNCAVLLMSKK